MVLHVVIVGGGLGGLCLAHALNTSGISVNILERDKGLDSRGQGLVIGLRQEGVDALTAAGQAQVLASLMQRQGPSDLAILDERGRTLIRARDFLKVELGCRDMRSSLLDRSALRRKLAEGLPAGVIKWGARVTSYDDRGEEGVQLVLEDGSTVIADVVVGADGANSALRDRLAPELRPESLGIWTLAGTLAVPDESAWATNGVYTAACQSLARLGGRDGCSLMTFVYFTTDPSSDQPTRTFLWSLSMPSATNTEIQQPSTSKERRLAITLDLLRSKFSSAEAEALVAATPPTSLDLAYDIVSVNPEHLASGSMGQVRSGRTTLLGDAAHKTTTQAGMGASAAFMDALDLADALVNVPSPSLTEVSAALRSYESKMASRAVNVVNESVGNTKRIHDISPDNKRRKVQWVMWTVGWILPGVQWATWSGRTLKRLCTGRWFTPRVTPRFK